MAVTMIRIMPRRKFTSSAAGISITVTAAEHIYIAHGTDLELIVRLHRNGLIGTNSTLQVALVHDLYDSQDPGNIYINSSSTIATTTFAPSDVAPKGIGIVGTTLGARYAALLVTMFADAANGLCDGDISADVNLRSYKRCALPPNAYVGFRHW